MFRLENILYIGSTYLFQCIFGKILRNLFLTRIGTYSIKQNLRRKVKIFFFLFDQSTYLYISWMRLNKELSQQ